jgi:hypothetical protein
MAVAVGVAVAVAGWQCVERVGCVIASILIGDKVKIGVAVVDGRWQMSKWQW